MLVDIVINATWHIRRNDIEAFFHALFQMKQDDAAMNCRCYTRFSCKSVIFIFDMNGEQAIKAKGYRLSSKLDIIFRVFITC
jgi:hypothetical protein